MLKWFKGKDSEAPAGGANAGGETDEKGMFGRLKDGLGKTRGLLAEGLRSATAGANRKIDEDAIEAIEEALLRADLGAKATDKIVERLRGASRREQGAAIDEALAIVKETMIEILEIDQTEDIELDYVVPLVILVVGVNGTGKTTSIGKLALQFVRDDRKVMLVAGDTFRAAAADQLEIWAQRSGAAIVRREEGADPAAVCFEGIEAAVKDEVDLVIVDTAGRLHTKKYLMDELEKVVRVIKKVDESAPHETILVLDATLGQNALNQVRVFKEVTKVSGLIMTKLDGTAKGGVLLAIKEEFGLPIYRIGIGESPEDMRRFDPREFVDALFEGIAAPAAGEGTS